MYIILGKDRYLGVRDDFLLVLSIIQELPDARLHRFRLELLFFDWMAWRLACRHQFTDG